MAELVVDQTLDFGEYLAAFRRRRGLILLVAGIVFLLGCVIALVWPPTYRASATILIEEQEIPSELVQSTVTSYASERIQVINQRVMSRSNLLAIIEKYKLYESERRHNTIEEILEDMRDDIGIDMINADVVDPRTGRPTAATIAFTVGFSGDNPQQALQVTSELTTLYLDENLKSRTEKATETYDFLTVESDRLRKEIARLEKALAEYKERNVNTLPELRDLNTQILDRTERDITDIDTQIRGLEERKVYLNGQLALLSPYGGNSGDVTNPSARLDALRTSYIGLTSRYSPDHPDVIRVRQEIRALELETGQIASPRDIEAQLETLRGQLATARKTYTDEHPDVKNLKRQIVSLEQDLKDANAAPAGKSAAGTADNPAYVTLSSQLAAAESETRSLRNKRAQLTDKVAEYEARLAQTPKSEQEYRTIARDLDNSSRRYQELRAKQMTAEVAQQMEKERKGEKFTLIDPAILPEEPISPNRSAILLLSLVLAIGAGIGSAAIRESMDSAVRGVKSLTAILNTAPLAVIPYLANADERSAHSRRRTLIVLAVLAAIVIALLLFNFLATPLDVMWFRGLRRLDTVVGE